MILPSLLPPGFGALLFWGSFILTMAGCIVYAVQMLFPEFKLRRTLHYWSGIFLVLAVTFGLALVMFNPAIRESDQCLKVEAWQYDAGRGLFNATKLAALTDRGTFMLWGDEALTTSAILEHNGAGWYQADIIGDPTIHEIVPLSLQRLRSVPGCDL
jgi:hypothetical protein